MKLYIISVGDQRQFGESLYEHFMEQLCQLVSEQYWNGKRVTLQLLIDGNTLKVSGGRKRLPMTEVELVSYEIDYPALQELMYSWQARIDMRKEIEKAIAIIILCDAKTFMDNFDVQIKVAKIRSMMMRIETNVPLRLFLMNTQQIMDAEKGLAPTEVQWRMTTALGCRGTRLLRLKEEYKKSWEAISSIYLLQWHIKFRSIHGRPLGIPKDLIANYRDGTSSGYIEIMSFILNRIGEKSQLSIELKSNKKMLTQINNLVMVPKRNKNYYKHTLWLI